jgi:hypothetical protein
MVFAEEAVADGLVEGHQEGVLAEQTVQLQRLLLQTQVAPEAVVVET